MKGLYKNIILLSTIIFSTLSYAGNEWYDLDPKEKIKMINAKDKFQRRDFKGALELYTEVYNNDKANAKACNYIGECYLALGQVENAIDFFQKATKLDPKSFKDIHMSMGMAFHRTGQLDQALEAFETYKRTLSPKNLKENDVLLYIDQVKTAKELMAKPVPVKIENVGESINSPYDDYAPSLSADGTTMIFTSRRPDTKGGQTDDEYDRKYYEDIYIATLDEPTGKWSDAEPIKGSLNTEGHDASLSISPSGKEIYLYKNISGETRSGDIFVSKLSASGKWGTPKPMDSQINSSYFESSACISPDGKMLLFVSERKGSIGNGDIWMIKKINRSTWGEPVNLGPMINTIEDEISVFLHPDGKTLFFSSRGHNSMGGYDIFKSTLEGGIWTKPENLGYPINTVGDDLHFVLTTDNKTAFYSNYRVDGLGERDIYKVDMTEYPVMKGKEEIAEDTGPALSILKGDIFDSNAGEALETEIVIMDIETNTVAAKISSGENGDYFITLPANKTYEVSIEKQGYKPVKEKVTLTAAKKGTATLVKHYLLDREKK